MGMVRRAGECQDEFWVASRSLASIPRHVFYDRLNELLGAAQFDRTVEELWEEFYSQVGRDSIPPVRYFRMLFVWYFEDIDSQRGIAWRCSDSLSLRRFLFLAADEESPDHSSLTKIRERLPLSVHEHVFALVLQVAQEKKLLKGNTVCVDSTMLEANAAMKSIVRKDSGEDWKAYLQGLAEAEGVLIDNDEDLRRFDQQRKKQGRKRVSNQEWESPGDPDSRITRMKDGRTHLGYKAEHVVDLDTEYIVGANVTHSTEGNASTLLTSVADAQIHLVRSGSNADIKEVVADKGYHANQTLTDCETAGLRTDIPERVGGHRRWQDKPPEMQSAFRGNRRRVQGDRGRRLQRQRSERVERSFAHVCNTGGGRRTWLRGLEKINKRYLIQIAARNLGLLMRDLFGTGKPRAANGSLTTLCLCLLIARTLENTLVRLTSAWNVSGKQFLQNTSGRQTLNSHKQTHFSTGCYGSSLAHASDYFLKVAPLPPEFAGCSP